jgi:uncharacterized protein DUF4126
MDLFLAISQGVGTSLATGLRSFLPPLLVCALARGDLAVDFDGSDYEFLESVPFLAGLLLVNVVAVLLERSGLRRSLDWPFLGVSLVLGGLIFAGSLAEEDYTAAPGLVAGAACVVLAYVASQTFLVRARTRLASRGEEESAGFLDLYAAGAALCLAALAVIVPPVSLLALGLCVWVLVVSRRRGSRKYEGLRVLR